ncbi:MAG: 3D domain-containing protein [Clostridia bacterium]|nr:3D domain-containing protein [Clostridia bacterium]
MDLSSKTSQKAAGILSLAVLLIVLVVTVAAAAITDTKNITVIDGEQVYHLESNGSTVGEVLEELDLSLQEEDKLIPTAETAVTEEMPIIISRAFTVEIVADGKTTAVNTASATVAEILTKANITLNEQDKINIAAETFLMDPAQIVINRITYGKVVETVAVQPKLVRKTDDDLEKGVTKVLSEGKAGEEKLTYEVVYKDGKEVMRTQVACETITPVQDKVVAYGTVSLASRGGKSFAFTKVITARATAYTATGHRTTSGTVPKVGTVAVDPNVIPLGTKLYVEGYGFATALDTGSAVKGSKVDIYLDTEKACYNWGVRTVRVYILK